MEWTIPGERLTKLRPPRGPVIGPLIIAGVTIESSRLRELTDLGVKDSKTLSPARRRFLSDRIRVVVRNSCLIEIQPVEIDHVVLTGKRLRKLNYLEARVMADVIAKLRPDIAYVDSSDIIPDRFASDISSMLPFEVRIISEHHADQRYPIVSAASILAKVRRDQVIDELTQAYGDLGSGYPSDPKTIRFLERWFDQHGSYPEFARKSWKTLRRITDRRVRRF